MAETVREMMTRMLPSNAIDIFTRNFMGNLDSVAVLSPAFYLRHGFYWNIRDYDLMTEIYNDLIKLDDYESKRSN